MRGRAFETLFSGAIMVVASSAFAAEVWVTNMKSANVEVIDPETLEIVATIPADAGARNVTFSRDGKLAFVANVGANNVTIADAEAKTVLGTVAAGERAHEVSVSPDNALAASSNVGTDFVTLIDVAKAEPLGEIKGRTLKATRPGVLGSQVLAEAETLGSRRLGRSCAQ